MLVPGTTGYISSVRCRLRLVELQVSHRKQPEFKAGHLGFSVVGTLAAPIEQLTLDDMVIAASEAPAEVKSVRGLRANGVWVGGSEIGMSSDFR